jgi:hypothetical protein
MNFCKNGLCAKNVQGVLQHELHARKVMQSLYGFQTVPFPRDSHAVGRPGGSAAFMLSFTAVKLLLEIAMDLLAVFVESSRAALEFCHLLWRASLPNQNSLPLSVLAGSIRPSVTSARIPQPQDIHMINKNTKHPYL